MRIHTQHRFKNMRKFNIVKMKIQVLEKLKKNVCGDDDGGKLKRPASKNDPRWWLLVWHGLLYDFSNRPTANRFDHATCHVDHVFGWLFCYSYLPPSLIESGGRVQSFYRALKISLWHMVFSTLVFASPILRFLANSKRIKSMSILGHHMFIA